MNNQSDSLQLDENLARLLAAYDQAIDGADENAQTIGVPNLEPLPGERSVTPLGGEPNEGSLNEVLPPSAAHPPQPSPQPYAHTPAPANGTPRIGRFELRRQLGKGGCGIVFLAFDPKLQREVALKIPRPEMLLSQDARRRLIREALAAAEFDHPNLVPVYETGEIGPVCFIATAFCPGQTLGEWLDKQAFPVPVRQTARLVATIAEAVQHAHDRGVLHRDLKPNNVILQPTKDDPNETEPPPGSCHLRGEYYVPRVVDFGLAKLLERGGPSETTTRQILGTPKYMAPEQAQARHDDVGPAADVYALGVILYEMLTGRAPYEGASDVEVLRLAIDGNLTAPRHIRADIPRDLEAICLKAMDRVPGKRYRTAIDLADDLLRFLEGKPTLARPLNWPGRAGRWLRRNDQAVALVTVTTIATVLLAFGSWSMLQTRRAQTDRDNVLRDQAQRTRGDQHQEYARNVHSAYLAWRAGDSRAATDYLDAASRIARTGGDTTDFAYEYLTKLIAAEKLAIVCPAGAVTALAVSPDGSLIATGHTDGTVAVWERTTGQAHGSVHAHDGAITYAVFPNTRSLQTADSLGLSKSWVVGTTALTPGPRPADFAKLPATLFCMVRHEKDLIAAGEDGVVRIWEDIAESTVVPAHSIPEVPVALAMHPEGARLAILNHASIELLSTRLSPQARVATGAHQFTALRFTSEGMLLAAEIRVEQVMVCEISSAVREKLRRALRAGASSVAFSADGQRLAVGDEGGQVTIWSLTDSTIVGTIQTGEGNPVRHVALSDDGKLIAATAGDGVRIWSVGDLNPISTIVIESPALFRFLPTADRLVIAGRSNVLKVCGVASGHEELAFHGHIGYVTGLGATSDGRTLVSGSSTGEVKFWDLRTGQEMLGLRRHSGAVTAVEFAPNSKLLITGSAARSGGGELAVWDIGKE
jgi:serine/threonine protein kinase/WD40 repeat protein